MIGREILTQGLSVHMTSNKMLLTIVNVVNVCDINRPDDINFDKIYTDAPQDIKKNY